MAKVLKASNILLWLFAYCCFIIQSEVTELNFTKARYDATIFENSFGMSYVTPSPSERMGIVVDDETLDIRYKITAGDNDQFFKAEAKRIGDFCFLRIRTKTAAQNVLNRERQDEYKLEVRATLKSRQRYRMDRHDRSEFASATLVVVRILDTNDLSPIFDPADYDEVVREDAPIQSSLFRISAEDADEGINGQVYYSFQEQTDHFAVHPSTGVVFLSRALSHKERSVYDLTVLAQDRGAKFRVGESTRDITAKLRVRVQPVNRHSPHIEIEHLPGIMEGGNADVYAILHVTDDDDVEGAGNRHGAIASVEIVAGDPDGLFRIMPGTTEDTYDICVLRFLDREQAPLGYNLTVRATDRGIPSRSTNKSVSVKVSDANDHAPRFTQTEYSAEVDEFAPPRTPVVVVHAVDDDTGANAKVVYELSDGNSDGTFGIHRRTGSIFTNKPLDYETRQNYVLTVTAMDSAVFGVRRRSSVRVSIKVTDSNDNDPIFKIRSDEVWVKENEFVGTVVTRVSAEDADSGENGYVSYSIANLNPTPFAIDHFTGEVKMAKNLDYESMRRTHVIKIRASDWGTPYRRQMEMTLTVHVEDVNDNRPQFERVDCVGSLARDAPPGTEVITLSAIDLDAGDIVSYSFPAGNEDGCFDLNKTTGVVSLRCDLRMSKLKERYLNFSATDGQFHADVMVVKVTIVNGARQAESFGASSHFKCRDTGVTSRLKEVMSSSRKNNAADSSSLVLQMPSRFGENRHAPNFITPSPSPDATLPLELLEDVSVGTRVLLVEAEDKDLGFNGKLAFALSSVTVYSPATFEERPLSKEDDEGVFRLDLWTGALTLERPLDRETADRYLLNVTAYDLGRPQRATWTTLNLSILDANDNPPKFTKPAHNVHLSEDSPLGTTVVILTATDPDVGPNADVIYTLMTDTEDFEVNVTTGVVTVKSTLDRERRDLYDLRVRAVDSSPLKPLSATAAVRVHILDVNDNAPKFISTQLVRVAEDLPVSSVIAAVTAVDPDSGVGGRITYSLKGYGHPFTVDKATGTIRIFQKLDFEEKALYNVTAVACDEAEPSLCSSTPLVVEIIDVNENLHAPEFDDFVAEGSVKENQPIGTWVMQAKAVDNDGPGPDSKITYSIRDGDGIGRFSIDHEGNIRTLEVLDRETSPSYWLTVFAQDWGLVPLHSHIQVYIVIQDENDNVPQTQKPVYYTSVVENSAPDVSILKIDAYDLDQKKNDRLTFRISGGNPQGFFAIDEDSGLIRTTNRKLDRERQDEHTLEVTVTDNGDPALTGTTYVIVTVEDINDNNPRFEENPYRIQIFESPWEEEEIRICRVLARDADTGPNADLDYSIIKPHRGFRINPKTGMIFARRNFTAGQSDEFSVRVEDNGRPRKSANARIQWEVIPRPLASSNPPMLASATMEAQVSENESVGHRVAHIQAKERDGDYLFYAIVGDSVSEEKFMIHSRTGDVFLAGPLDWETRHSYNLNISVTDGFHITYGQLEVQVADVNEHRPEFSSETYVVDVSESAAIGTDILQLRATDEDKDKRIFYALLSSADPSSSSKFLVDSSTGVITVIEPLDREFSIRHVLTVFAKDQSVLTKRGFARVVVNVIDHNDHAPTFLTSPMEARVHETAVVGSTVIRVQAVDSDKGPNAQIRYSILSGNVGSAFTIDPTLGVISVAKELDMHNMPDYWISVKAMDHGNPSLSSTAHVHILVSLPDNAPPRFAHSVYSADVYENHDEGFTVIEVAALSQSTLYYELTGGNDHGRFAISPNSGTISCRVPLDYEEEIFYNLTVTVSNSVGKEASATVLVRVRDVNDNGPYFVQQQFFGNITEAAAVGSVVLSSGSKPLVVLAEDKDSELNGLLIYEIVERSAKEFFSIDPSTGAIRTAAKLDHEQQSVYDFSVQVSDMGKPRRMAEAPARVHIHIDDVNDTPPVFEHTVYNATLLLPTYVGVIVADVHAHDGDFDISSPITYELGSDGPFVIDMISGVISVHDPHGLSESYQLSVKASDGLFIATTKVNVSVTEVPGNSLKLGLDRDASVMENTSDSMTFAVLTVLGAELNEHLIFRILNPDGMFSVGTTSGVLRSTGVPFDREVKDSYSVAVEVLSTFDELKVAHTLVHVKVTDVNDNKPVFVRLPYYAVVHRNAQKGDAIFKIRANDADIGGNGEVLYELSDENSELFNIHRKTGEITLQRPLSEEEASRDHQLTVTAVDGGIEPQQSQAIVHVKVIHSSMPVFESQYYRASVLENSPTESPVITVQATSPAGRKLIYSIVDGNMDEEFSVDFNAGVVYVVDQLDFETRKSYQLILRATDAVSGAFSDAILQIDVEDMNDNSPEFAHSVYKVSVPETSPVGTTILTLEANDRDSGHNMQVFYRISAASTLASEYLSLHPSEGSLIVRRQLDFERMKDLNLVVVAVDGGSPSLSSTAHVWIKVSDMNDSPPQFERSSYECAVSEDAHRGQFVTKVEAVDPDVSDQIKLKYAIVAGNDHQVFSINKQTGIVTLTNPFQLSKNSSHVMDLSVSDGVYTSYTRLKVSVLSANHRAPRFERARFEVEFEENQPAGSLITVLKATDDDRDLYGQIEYHISSERAEQFFEIEVDKGEVRSKRSLDREIQTVYEVPVVAVDGGGRTGFTLLRILVADVNDNPPQFRLPAYKASVRANASIGTPVLQLEATDADTGAAATIEYLIYGSKSRSSDGAQLFDINKQTGEITTKQSALFYGNQVFQFFVKARDKGSPSLAADVPVDIYITGVEEDIPFFTKKSSQYFIHESAPLDTLVTSVNAISNHTLSYSLSYLTALAEERNPLFRVSNEGAVIVCGEIDREVQDVFVLTIRAEAVSNPTLTTYANVTVQVMDENDHAPVFESDPYRVNVAENVAIGTSILRAVATDKDLGHNGEVRYSLDSASVFDIEPSTGWITTLVLLDRETVSQYEIVVIAEDNGNPKMSSTTSVEIDVDDYNDNPPVFSKFQYASAVNEDAVEGTVIVTVITTDGDLGPNAKAEYYITDGDPHGHFHIGQTGDIYVNKALDRETIPNYLLQVTATDGTFVATCSVSIMVLDVNDNPPLCKKTRYLKRISESISTSLAILTVETSDADELDNSKLQFFLSGEGAEEFILDHSTGTLRTSQALDREKKAWYFLTAHVQDKDHKDWECMSDVEIAVTDVNDNAPEFTQRVYSVTVPENTEVKSLVAKVHASDKDLGINRKIRYSFVDSSDGHFTIDDTSGLVSLAKSLDREERAMFNLTVQATDQGTPQLSTVASLLVVVLDINDNPPEFTRKIYSISVPENLNPANEIIRVFATSRDSGVNAEITYSIVEGNKMNTFAINPKNGIISLQKELDYEKWRECLLIVQANDGGTPSLSNQAQVNISVIDVNDNSPRFGETSYGAVIPEDVSIGTRILQVFAADADSGNNGMVSYSIVSGDPSKRFNIDRQSGVITVAASLDREKKPSFSLRVQASDGGTPNLGAIVMVNVNVSDVNDNPPVFAFINHSTIVQEDKPLGCIIFKFNVTDPDLHPNGEPFSFDIINGNAGNEFRMVQDGTLRTATKFNHKLRDQYELLVRVHDNGTPPLYADTWVSVLIIEESRYPPHVMPLDASVNLYRESFPGGGVIGRVVATDQDPHDTLSYDIVPEHRIGVFDINREDGTVVAPKGLDAGRHVINVSVSDGKFVSYTEVRVGVNMITDEMLRSAVVLQLSPVSPEEFILTYHDGFQQAVQLVLKMNSKVEILNIQPAVPANSARNRRHYNTPNEQENEDISQALDVVFVARNPKAAYVPASEMRASIVKNKDVMERHIGLKILQVQDDVCLKSPCKHGECRPSLSFDEKVVISVTTDTISYVSPQYHRSVDCKCHVGFKGPLCDQEVNACARVRCPSLHVCEPTNSHPGYICRCSEGSSCGSNRKCTQGNCYEERNPISFRGSSYAAITLSNASGRNTNVSLQLRTFHPRGCVMFAEAQTDYSILEVVNGYIQYRFNCGSGEGLVKLEQSTVNDGSWHHVSLERDGHRAELTLDRKWASQGVAPGKDEARNRGSHVVILGAEIRVPLQEIVSGFVGCLDDVHVNRKPLPLHHNEATSKLKFVNVEQCPGVCNSHPCLNGGKCHPALYSKFTCDCPSNFNGPRCEMEANPCQGDGDFSQCYCNSHPCLNGGTCQESYSGPLCKCKGYTGDFCDVDIDECLQSPCGYGSTCINVPGSYRCQCPPNTTGPTCSIPYFGADLSTSTLNITVDEIVGIVVTVAAIALMAAAFALVRKCLARRRHQHRQVPVAAHNADLTKEIILKNKTHNDEIKRNSKNSNLEMALNPPLPPRPASYTPSTQDAYPSPYGFDTVRSYGSAGDDLETAPRFGSDFPPMNRNNATVASTAVPPALPPPPSANNAPDSESLHKHSWDIGRNLQKPYFDSKLNKADDMKMARGEQHSIPLPVVANFKLPIGQANHQQSLCESNLYTAPVNVPPVTAVPPPPSSFDDLSGYHWDTSDWDPSQNPLPNITEVPGHEVPDSPSVHSNESNTHVGVVPASSTEDNGPTSHNVPPESMWNIRNNTNIPFSDIESEYIGGSECTDHDSEGPIDFPHILSQSSLDLPSSYHIHPNDYLPSHNLTATDTEAEDYGIIGTPYDRHLSNLGASSGRDGHQGSYFDDEDDEERWVVSHSGFNPLTRQSLGLDNASISVGGNTSTNASCSDVSGNLCEIEDSVCSDGDLEIPDHTPTHRLIQNTAATAL